MSIELHSETVAPDPRPFDPLPVKRVTFESRKASFRFETGSRAWTDHAVNFYVGPLGLWLTADEAEAMGKAMTECAEHFRAVTATKGAASHG